jgi:hypothetical protein
MPVVLGTVQISKQCGHRPNEARDGPKLPFGIEADILEGAPMLDRFDSMP